MLTNVIDQVIFRHPDPAAGRVHGSQVFDHRTGPAGDTLLEWRPAFRRL